MRIDETRDEAASSPAHPVVDPTRSARSRRARFTHDGFAHGVVRILPLLPALALYGMAFGLAAANAGLSCAETVAFSAIVYAGAAQMAALQAWADPVPLVTVVASMLAMNARYLVVGATLHSWLSPLPGRLVYPTLFVVGDGNWALAMKERARGLDDGAFLLGSGMAMWATWVVASAIGHVSGALLRDPARYGADVLLVAFFAAMLAAFTRRASDLVPCVTAALVAILIDLVAPEPWPLIAGALAGAATRSRRGDNED